MVTLRRAPGDGTLARMAGTDVNVLFGGSSSERRVSVASAQHVLAILDEAVPWFLAPTGAVHVVRRDELARFDRPFERDFDPRVPATFASLIAAVESQPDRVCLLALHGGEGEDGTIQRMLETRRIAFTGPGADASARAFDKEVAKQVARAAGVRIAHSVHLSKDPKVMRTALRDLLGLYQRLVVKPIAGGSSVGLYLVASEADAERAARGVEESGDAYLAEEFVAGPELTVGVVDGESGPRALPPSEVRVEQGRAFDYEGKYLGKGTTEITPAQVSPEVKSISQALAITAHQALGCYGYSRTDLIVSARGPVFLETNTLPGLTRQSFIPQQLAAEGTPMRAFLEGQLALARQRR